MEEILKFVQKRQISYIQNRLSKDGINRFLPSFCLCQEEEMLASRNSIVICTLTQLFRVCGEDWTVPSAAQQLCCFWLIQLGKPR
jgi:hypothetical protein